MLKSGVRFDPHIDSTFGFEVGGHFEIHLSNHSSKLFLGILSSKSLEYLRKSVSCENLENVFGYLMNENGFCGNLENISGYFTNENLLCRNLENVSGSVTNEFPSCKNRANISGYFTNENLLCRDLENISGSVTKEFPSRKPRENISGSITNEFRSRKTRENISGYFTNGNVLRATVSKRDVYIPFYLSCGQVEFSSVRATYFFSNPAGLLDQRWNVAKVYCPIFLALFGILFLIWLINWILHFTPPVLSLLLLVPPLCIFQ
jgi:hypothetical protein